MPPDPPSGSHLRRLRAPPPPPPPTYITLATALSYIVEYSYILV